MSAGLDQRAKGQSNQVANGTKDGIKDGFDTYLQPTHQAAGVYNTAPMSSPVSDHYMSSYYPSVSFPYLSQGLGEGTWSNGDPMSFLGGYGQMNNEYISNSGMFGFSYGQPGFAGWDFPGSDYTSFTWGASAPQQTPARKDARYDDMYCHSDNARPVDQQGYALNGDMDSSAKSVEHGMKAINISEQYSEAEPSVQDNVSHTSQAPCDQAPVATAPKKMSWANVASQPAKPQPPLKAKNIPRAPVLPYKHSSMDIGTWETKTNMVSKPVTPQARQAWSASSRRQGSTNPAPPGSASSPNNTSTGGQSTGAPKGAEFATGPSNLVLEKLRSSNQYNPKEFNLAPKSARFFIIKSYSEDDIHRSIKYSIWCSTDHGNKRLDKAYRENESKGPIYLLYSVNGSGHFCGMAQMLSSVDYNNDSSVWAQDKWKGQFQVKWIYVKDVPNSQLRHIRLENNENKPVTNSRDTQEVPLEKGRQVLKILHAYRHTTSIFDDFTHYEKRQEELAKPEVNERESSPREGQRSDRGDRQERNDRSSDRDVRDSRGGDARDNRGDNRGGDARDSRGDNRGGDARDSRGDARGDNRGGDARDSRGDARGDNRGDARDNRGDARGDARDNRGDVRGGQDRERRRGGHRDRE